MFNKMIKPALAAGIAAGFSILAVSAPASAQVNGMAVAEASVAVASSTALQTGFQQVGTQYSAQITQLDGLQQQRAGLLQTFDADGNGQLDETEQAALNASATTVQQITALETQINAAQAPIQLARLYVVSQVGQQYAAAVQQVIADKSIQILLSPEAIIYAPEAADVTQAVAEAINARLPTASITPPADWSPNQATVNLYQQVQQVFALARQQAQANGAAGAATAAPATEGR